MQQLPLSQIRYTVTDADVTAGYSDIETGLEFVTGAVVMVTRAGAVVTADAIVTLNTGGAGEVRVADGGATLNLVAADIIDVVATGKPQ